MKDKPHWMKLCQQASVEQDPEKLMELITEITRLLDEKQTRLRQAHAESEDTKLISRGTVGRADAERD